ncbi:hypothetical protein GCM10011581_19750 [Saccharopolyspora subtropica]|uniref:Pyoverdine/dityrosine biosynthesis protein n=1 Tax=Saccharopolyspora thermophila TaxID=89367 RepID=A0A917NA91_9PSEU|nr:hypothetical protein GCM10011581_19750 [Saccharopolyspora subtropica]
MYGPGRLRQRARELIARDALLPLHCQVVPPDEAAEAVLLRDLLGEQFRGEALPVKRFLESRPDSWAELDYLLEFVVRPVVVTFRGLLVAGLLPAGDIGVEADAELGATGRVLLTEVITAESEPAVSRAVSAVHQQLVDLVLAAAEITGVEQQRALSAVDDVLTQELRYLSEDAAAAFAGEHPWRPFVHCVAAQQDELVRHVLQLVREAGARRRRDERSPQPLVAVDLDFCALHPRRRVREALSAVGKRYDVDELVDAASLPVLPGLYQAAWRPFLERTGLPARHPGLDWDACYAEFRGALSWQRTALLTDEVAPGLVRFVRDVEHAGGRVVWLTGRRHRMRDATEELLARCGLGHVPLHTTDDGPVAGIADQKVAALRGMAGHELIAAFDDSAANRRALRAAFPDAVVVAVGAPGFTAQDSVEDTWRVATFESVPHPLPLGRGHVVHVAGEPRAAEPRLSHATSIAQLRVGEFSTHPAVWRRGVELTAEQQRRIVKSLCGNAIERGRQLGRRVRAGTEGVVRALWRVITAKPFGAARSAYPPEAAESDMRAAVEANLPVPLVMLGPPTKQDGSRLKALGGLPDLAEVAMLARLLQLDAAIRQIHPPGIRVTALADPSHFRFRAPGRYQGYHEAFADLLDSTGARDIVVVRDIDDAADEHPDCGDRAQRPALLDEHRARYTAAFEGLDIRRDPLAVLAEADARDPGHPGQPRFVELFRSVLHAVDVPHRGGDPFAWSQQIYADPYELSDRTVPAEVRAARADLLDLTWRETITYLANKHVDADLNYGALWGRDRVRMSFSIRPTPGRFRFIPLGGSGVMPWHGTAVLNAHHEVSVDYAISLAHQAFVPIYRPGGGPQPWFMVPLRDLSAGHLDPELHQRITIRNR